MALPVYVVTGFLDAGKTTFINKLINKYYWKEDNILLLQFEIGEKEFNSRRINCQNLSFTKKFLEQHPEDIINQISEYIHNNKIDEIWVEWNGVASFSKLEEIFYHSKIRSICKIQKVIHVANATSLENLIGRTGNALIEQIANSDFAVLRNAPSITIYNRIKRLLKGINSDIDVYKMNEYDEIHSQLFEKTDKPISSFFVILALFITFFFIGKPILEILQFPINTITNIFLGIILQAFPFLLIGVLLSSAIQVFIPQRTIEKWFSKSTILGIISAIIGGFCIPVCDCASIPVFKSLVKKGVPLPVAVTFMTVSPVINPVVILSTYYAFGGDMKIVYMRIIFGIITSVIIGLIMGFWAKKEKVLTGGIIDGVMCSCGCYEGVESVDTLSKKIQLFIRHSKIEFFNVGKYLVIGTVISSIFQVMGTGIFTFTQGEKGLAISMVLMMTMAFLLSLCSSSDAVIARSFANQFPLGAVMGFLVFGPMMDIKNLLMLSSGFTKSFILKLLFTIFTVCFIVVFLFFSMGGI